MKNDNKFASYEPKKISMKKKIVLCDLTDKDDKPTTLFIIGNIVAGFIISGGIWCAIFMIAKHFSK